MEIYTCMFNKNNAVNFMNISRVYDPKNCDLKCNFHFFRSPAYFAPLQLHSSPQQQGQRGCATRLLRPVGNPAGADAREYSQKEEGGAAQDGAAFLLPRCHTTRPTREAL